MSQPDPPTLYSLQKVNCSVAEQIRELPRNSTLGVHNRSRQHVCHVQFRGADSSAPLLHSSSVSSPSQPQYSASSTSSSPCLSPTPPRWAPVPPLLHPSLLLPSCPCPPLPPVHPMCTLVKVKLHLTSHCGRCWLLPAAAAACSFRCFMAGRPCSCCCRSPRPAGCVSQTSSYQGQQWCLPPSQEGSTLLAPCLFTA